MDNELEGWLEIFAAGAGTAYAWEITARGWLRTCTEGWCPLLAQGTQTGEILEPRAVSKVYEVGARQGLSVQACSEVIRAADRNPYRHDSILRVRLLSICHVEEAEV